MHREIQRLRRVGEARDTAVAVEIGADAHMVDTHHLDGVLQMRDGVENRGLSVFAEEAGVERRVRHATLGRESAQLVVGEVPRMVAQRPTVRVAAHDGRLADVKRIVEAFFCRVAEVNHHAVAVHLGNDLLSERAHSAMRVAAARRVADVVVAIVAERDVGHAALRKSTDVFELVLQRKTVFNGQNDGFQPHSLVFTEVVGRAGESQVRLLLLDDGFNLVENAVGVCIGRESGQMRRERREFLVGLWLRQIGRHRNAVQTPVGHLVQIDEDARVALLEMDALREEHRRVAMGVERQNFFMYLFGFVIVTCFFHEPSKELQALFLQPFRMPLHAQNRLVLGAFHRLDGAVGSRRRDAESLPGVVNGLMVQRIHENSDFLRRIGVLRLLGSVNLRQAAVGFDAHAVRRLRAVAVLRVLDAAALGNVLRNVSVECHRERLHSAADAENGNLAVVGQARDEQLGQVASRIDAAELRSGFLARPQRVVVGAAAEQQSVELLQHTDNHVLIGHGRNDDGRAASPHHLFVVGVAQGGVFASVVGRDANQRTRLGFRKSGVNRLKMRWQVEFLHYFSFSFSIPMSSTVKMSVEKGLMVPA